PGTSSSTSPGASCPSGYDNGHMGFNKQELVLAVKPEKGRDLLPWSHLCFSVYLPPSDASSPSILTCRKMEQRDARKQVQDLPRFSEWDDERR
ncbi:hypothetical protein, partial [Gluconacetobacter diazotrophicus]|uniref:hypothetical protein n=1 Tax=Gluconacetobacter diazotrophicus TaxID=33996 RepID=UPI001C97D3FB